MKEYLNLKLTIKESSIVTALLETRNEQLKDAEYEKLIKNLRNQIGLEIDKLREADKAKKK